jgi:hypothetical protein
MLFPPQLGIKSHNKIFSCVGIWNFCVIDEDWLLFNLVGSLTLPATMETLAFKLLVTMQRNNTGVVSVSMELLRLPSNDKSVA